MTDAQKTQISNLRAAGLGYKKIAEQMELSENTVKTYCRRHGLGGAMAHQVERTDKSLCQCCGVEVKQNPGRKVKKFCPLSDIVNKTDMQPSAACLIFLLDCRREALLIQHF